MFKFFYPVVAYFDRSPHKSMLLNKIKNAEIISANFYQNFESLTAIEPKLINKTHYFQLIFTFFPHEIFLNRLICFV